MRRPSSPYASSFSFGPGPVSTTLKALIAANVVMFLVTTFAQSVVAYLGLVPTLVLHQFWVWQVATYMFLHGGIFHIVFNMLALWMFGAELERIWGTRYFLKFYFVTGIATLLASLGAGWLWDRDGASTVFLTGGGLAAVAWAMLALLPQEPRASA